MTRDAQQNGDGARDTTSGPPGRTSDIKACLGFMYCDREPVKSLCGQEAEDAQIARRR